MYFHPLVPSLAAPGCLACLAGVCWNHHRHVNCTKQYIANVSRMQRPNISAMTSGPDDGWMEGTKKKRSRCASCLESASLSCTCTEMMSALASALCCLFLCCINLHSHLVPRVISSLYRCYTHGYECIVIATLHQFPCSDVTNGKRAFGLNVIFPV